MRPLPRIGAMNVYTLLGAVYFSKLLNFFTFICRKIWTLIYIVVDLHHRKKH